MLGVPIAMKDVLSVKAQPLGCASKILEGFTSVYDATVVEKLKALGLEPWISTPEELAKYQATEMVKWAKVVKDSGAKAD